jgi:hypothetical protein
MKLAVVARRTTSLDQRRVSADEKTHLDDRSLLSLFAKRRALRVDQEKWPVRWAIRAIIALSLIGWMAIFLVTLLLYWHPIRL